MKKLDKLLIKSFVGPFVLTFAIAVFILLTQFMLKYFDDFVGKNLGPDVFIKLIFYFAIHMTPVALPLAVLLSSIMTFGNLGEHFELTAIRSSGITLTRVLLPIFAFTLLLTGIAMYSNDQIVTRANLKAWTLLYDIKQKKPSLDLKEGIFYSGIPGYSIKVNEKLPDNKTIKDIVIYDHTQGQGNNNIILADSGLMYTIMDENYLVFELFQGNNYSETEGSRSKRYRLDQPQDLTRTRFDRSKIVFNLSSFDWERTDESLFANHKYMKSMGALQVDIDSMETDIDKNKLQVFKRLENFHMYHGIDRITAPERLLSLQASEEDTTNTDTAKKDLPLSKTLKKIPRTRTSRVPEGSIMVGDSLITPTKGKKSDRGVALSKNNRKAVRSADSTDLLLAKEQIRSDSAEVTVYNVMEVVDSVIKDRKQENRVYNIATNKARYAKTQLSIRSGRIESLDRYIDHYHVEKYKKIAQAISCLIMFLIGAPLGSIIKKGGLGVPVLISIAFFIIFYVLTITGEKWGKEGVVDSLLGVWIPNLTLLPFGIFFLVIARRDARIFEADFYLAAYNKVKSFWEMRTRSWKVAR